MDPLATLRALVDAIDSTGGCTRDEKGYIVPAADEDWLDLGTVYLDACRILGLSPVIHED